MLAGPDGHQRIREGCLEPSSVEEHFLILELHGTDTYDLCAICGTLVEAKPLGVTKLTDDQRQTVLDLHECGVSQRKIATQVGIGIRTVALEIRLSSVDKRGLFRGNVYHAACLTTWRTTPEGKREWRKWEREMHKARANRQPVPAPPQPRLVERTRDPIELCAMVGTGILFLHTIRYLDELGQRARYQLRDRIPTVTRLAEALRITKSTLYKRLRALIDLLPAESVCSPRLRVKFQYLHRLKEHIESASPRTDSTQAAPLSAHSRVEDRIRTALTGHDLQTPEIAAAAGTSDRVAAIVAGRMKDVVQKERGGGRGRPALWALVH
jgi:hypothetical protein